jgi:hypothetical protein
MKIHLVHTFQRHERLSTCKHDRENDHDGDNMMLIAIIVIRMQNCRTQAADWHLRACKLPHRFYRLQRKKPIQMAETWIPSQLAPH